MTVENRNILISIILNLNYFKIKEIDYIDRCVCVCICMYIYIYIYIYIHTLMG